jgi:acyl-CoA dehydrogenase
VPIFDPSYLDLPWFEARHRDLAVELEAWAEARGPELARAPSATEVLDVGRATMASLADDGWLSIGLGAPRRGVEGGIADWRSICLVREALAFCGDAMDFAFSIQALAAAPILRYGTEAQRVAYVPAMGRGELVGALALTEREIGSDISAIRTRAVRDGAGYRLTGEKVWIANASLAGLFCILARTGDGAGLFDLSMFLVPAHTPGLIVGSNVDLCAPRALAAVRLEDCVVPAENVIGRVGYGFRYAVELLERFRPTVGAAALGFARRAMQTALHWAQRRVTSGTTTLYDMQMTKERFADMATAIDAAALLVGRAAWALDQGRPSARHCSAAKLVATENAQRVVDSALQVMGAAGLIAGSTTERLYREIRSLRIYEGTSEIQKLIIAGTLV